jgi:glycosyltransferase involved in cell wall biosynthesis
LAPIYINDYLSRTNRQIVKGYRIKKIPLGFRKIIRSTNRFLSFCAIESLLPQIVHETYYSPIAHVPKRSKRVITVHDMIPELFPFFFPNSRTVLKHKKRAIEQADQIICVSKSTRDDLMHFYSVPIEKISVIYHGTEQFTELSKSTSTELENKFFAPYLLYVGSRRGYKNFHNFLYAFGISAWLKNNFKIIAFGGEYFDKEDSIILDKAGLSDKHVIFTFGSDEKLHLYYKNACAFVYPSMYEGFGLPILEAMHANCPVICSNISSFPEVAGNTAEYFDPNDIDSIRSVIERTLNSPEKRSEMANAGALRSKIFTWERCAKETFSTYQKAFQDV